VISSFWSPPFGLKFFEPAPYGVTLGVKFCDYLLKGVYGVFLSPLTPRMLHSDCGMQGIGEKTDLTLA